MFTATTPSRGFSVHHRRSSNRRVQRLLRIIVGSFIAACVVLGIATNVAASTGVSSTSQSSLQLTQQDSIEPDDTPAAEQDTAPPEDFPRVVATLTVNGRPIAGVTMIVSQDGADIGIAESDETGFVAVEVPAVGQYDVTLDPDTLPEGVTFSDPERSTLNPRILRPTGDRNVLFNLTSDGSTPITPGPGASDDETDAAAPGDSAAPIRPTAPTFFERFLSLLISGTRFGLVIAVAAVGLSLIFGTTGLTNFAHGELITFGAFAAWLVNSQNDGLGMSLWIAAIVAVIVGTLFGASFELGIYRPLRKRGMPIVTQMVVSIGLAFTIRYLFTILFGANARQFSQYAAQAPTIDLGIISVRPKDLVISAIAIVILIVVGIFLQRSRLGTAIRAVSDNHDLSVASGINDQRVILMVWMLAGGLGAVSGVMLGSADFVGWSMGQRVLLVMFAAVLLGGLGTIYGAMLGGLFVGIVSDLSTLWLDADLKIVVALGTLVLVLLFRPQGVFGVKARTA